MRVGAQGCWGVRRSGPEQTSGLSPCPNFLILKMELVVKFSGSVSLLPSKFLAQPAQSRGREQ